MRLARLIRGAGPTRRQWRQWVETEPRLAELGDPDGIGRALRGGPPQRQDELLSVLVRLAQGGAGGGDAAVLVLARCLWPGMRHRVIVHGWPLDVDEAFSIMVAGLVEAVHGYDPAARPRFVAAGLLAGPTRRLHRAASLARQAADDVHDVSDEDYAAGLLELSAAGLLGLAVDAGVLRAADAWLIRATRAEGLALAAAAGRLGLSYEAAKKRRQRAERRWADWWAPDHHSRNGDDRRGRR